MSSCSVDAEGESRRVFLAGATGFVGRHILGALLTRGHTVTCLVRPGSRRSIDDAYARTVEGHWIRPETWIHHVVGHEVVINAVGIIRERRGSTYVEVQTTTPIALVDAAKSGGVRKVIQVSALGADESARTAFHRTKRSADRYLASSGVPHLLLRPSFVYGPGDHSMSLFRRLASLPLTPIPGDGTYCVQPLHVDDLAHAVVIAVERDDLRDMTIDLGGATILTFRELLDNLAGRSGEARGARFIQIPWPLMRVVATITDLLGGHGPMTSDELWMLRKGNVAGTNQFEARFGFAQRPFTG